MSEKVTFRELIESIAEETDNSKQFTRDFLKDFVDVINDGLEQDRKVNIAGFGKFKLRRMDEREGYNPQTEEKITIPAHNKIVFKPYKDLRELVNAPYEHLESELIEEDETPAEDSAEYGDTESQESEAKEQKEPEDSIDQGNRDDFIPTAPPTSHQPNEEGQTEDEPISEDPREKEEQPFAFDDDSEAEKSSEISAKEDHKSEESDDEDEDVVEFNAEEETAEKEEEDSFEIDNFISSIEPSDSEDTEINNEQTPEEVTDSGEKGVDNDQEESDPLGMDSEESKETANDDLNEFMDSSSDQPAEEKSFNSEEETSEEVFGSDFTEEDAADSEEEPDPFAPEFEDTADENQDHDVEEEAAQPKSPTVASDRRSQNRKYTLPILAAAAVVLILVAAGAWYFTNSSDGSDQQIADSEPTSTTAIAAQEDDQEQSTDQSESEAADQDQQQPQSQATSGSTDNTDAQEADNTNSTDLEIEEGQTLWSIAEEKYGNPRLWPWIYGDNGSLNDPDLILAGKSLSVPLPSGPQNSLNNADSLGVARGFLATYNWFRDHDRTKAKDHLWAAKTYHNNIRDITDIKIDKADLSYANRAR